MLERMALRGGNWNNGANAGVFNLNLNNLRSNSNNNIGFRSAVLLVRNFKRMALVGSMKENGLISPALRRNIELLMNQLVANMSKGDTISAIVYEEV